MEEFRKIEGTNYSISNVGRVRNDKTSYILKCSNSWNGYRRISLSLGKTGSKKGFQIHRLVAEYFIPNPDNKPEVNHKDWNKKNNKCGNLEWATKKENTDHAVDNDLMVVFKGEEHGCSKLKDEQVISIGNSLVSTKDLAETYNVSIRTIQRIRSGKSWKHLKLDEVGEPYLT